MSNKIEPYFEICPDYEGCLGNFSIDHCSYGCEDDTLELEGYESTPFVMPGLEAWCWEWDTEAHRRLDAKRDGIDYKPIENNWIERGLDLAQRLRQILPNSINLYFRKGSDSVMLDKITYFVLSPDCNFFIGDTNEYSVAYDGDECAIADFLPFPLPGLDKWWHDFDRHVDYADSTADPDFDWATWTIKGLEFAKEIRRHLPSTVEVWYRHPFETGKIFPHPDLLVKEDGTFLVRDFLKNREPK